MDRIAYTGRAAKRCFVFFCCEQCEEPTSLVHIEPSGERVYGACAEEAATIREALAAHRRNEIIERIRVQRVLAREGIAGYGGDA